MLLVANMDYFISGDLIEPEEGAHHYSEKLYRVSTIPTYYYPIEKPKTVKNKRKLNGKGTQVIKAGEILEIFTPGGAGLGNYSERDNELIQTDIENELL